MTTDKSIQEKIQEKIRHCETKFFAVNAVRGLYADCPYVLNGLVRRIDRIGNAKDALYRKLSWLRQQA